LFFLVILSPFIYSLSLHDALPISYLSIENQEKHNLVLYPNPAQEEIYIENLTATAEIEIYNISGKKLLQQQVNSSTESINISNLDRKSTRLNSSHVSISYAVSCLT